MFSFVPETTEGIRRPHARHCTLGGARVVRTRLA